MTMYNRKNSINLSNLHFNIFPISLQSFSLYSFLVVVLYFRNGGTLQDNTHIALSNGNFAL